MAIAIPMMMVAGAAIAAYGSMQQAKAQSEAAQFNAKINEQNATAALQQADAQAAIHQRQTTLDQGSLIAAYGAAGVTGDGSPLDTLSMSVSNAELDRQNILYNGRLKATVYYNEATLAHRASTTAIEQGNYQAASSLLTGAGRTAYGYSGMRRGTPITRSPQAALTSEDY